jgi:hypothetical protein
MKSIHRYTEPLKDGCNKEKPQAGLYVSLQLDYQNQPSKKHFLFVISGNLFSKQFWHHFNEYYTRYPFVKL